MNESILDSIKKLMGADHLYDAFDEDLIIHINTVLGILSQMGVRSVLGFSIKGRHETWGEYLENELNLEMVKTYVYLKVKLIFDPPSNSSVIKAYEDSIKELEWRINVEVDPS